MPSNSSSFSETQHLSNLIRDYLEGKATLDHFYGLKFEWDNFEHQFQAKSAQYTRQHRRVLVEVLQSQYQSITPSSLVLKAIDDLKSDTTFTVTTGHQLSLMSGPLFVIYKIITTLNLAKKLNAKYSKHKFIPVFWMASEDHDFEEINHFYFRGQSINWPIPASGAVGRLSTASLTHLKSTFSSVLGDSKSSDVLRQLFDQAYLEHSTLAEATRVLIHSLFASEQLVVIDGDSPALKRLFLPHIQDELLHQTTHQNVVEDSKALEQLNYKPQAHPRTINLFYLNEGLRERIIKDGDVFKLPHNSKQWGMQEILNEAETHPERFSPNVLMRPLYQETILPNLCYVGGAGELAYWFQLKSLFKQAAVRYPILVLRNSAVLLTKKQHSLLDSYTLKISDLFLDSSTLSKKIVHQKSPLSIDFTVQKKHLKEQFKALYGIAAQTDRSFLGAVAAQEKKQLKGLEHLEKRLMKAEKKRHSLHLQSILELQRQLFPGGNLQERVCNFSEFYLNYGDNLFDRLKNQLDPEVQEFHSIIL